MPIPQVLATSLGLDGDNNTLSEFNTVYGSQGYALHNNSNITVSDVTGSLADPNMTGKKFQGITLNYPVIDTTQTNVMVTTTFINTTTLNVRVGASTTGASNYTNRTYSIWLKEILDNSLPVVLESFTANLLNQKTNLNWSTTSESNLDHFSVEKSTDGIHFSQAGMVFASGNTSVKTNYVFTDDVSGIQAPVVYYRLNMVDADGKSRYSDIRMVKLSAKQDNVIAITTYPNPVVNSINVTIPASW